MTTAKQPGSSRASGNVAHAQRRSAEARRCPECERASALVSVKPRPLAPGETTTYCRWDDCRYARVVPS